MAYYRVCPNCGCSLDPGERCDCVREKQEQKQRTTDFYNQFLTVGRRGGQLAFAFDGRREVGMRRE